MQAQMIYTPGKICQSRIYRKGKSDVTFTDIIIVYKLGLNSAYPALYGLDIEAIIIPGMYKHCKDT